MLTKKRKEKYMVYDMGMVYYTSALILYIKRQKKFVINLLISIISFAATTFLFSWDKQIQSLTKEYSGILAVFMVKHNNT